jgi:hypothetical protein
MKCVRRWSAGRAHSRKGPVGTLGSAATNTELFGDLIPGQAPGTKPGDLTRIHFDRGTPKSFACLRALLINDLMLVLIHPAADGDDKKCKWIQPAAHHRSLAIASSPKMKPLGIGRNRILGYNDKEAETPPLFSMCLCGSSPLLKFRQKL